MTCSELSKLVGEAEKALGLVFEEAVGLLKNFDTLTPDAFENAILRRDEILNRFHDLDNRITLQRDRMVSGTSEEYEAYRQSKETTIKKILETDSVLIALAREQLSVIQGDLAALVKGKKALHAYERGSIAQSHSLNDSV